MVAPINKQVRALTGRTRGRPTLFSKRVTMQVEVLVTEHSPLKCTEFPASRYIWQEATVADLLELNSAIFVKEKL